MKIVINNLGTEKKPFRLRLPRWLYMNSVFVTLLASKKSSEFTPKQARRALRAVKKAMREHKIKRLATISVEAKDANVEILL